MRFRKVTAAMAVASVFVAGLVEWQPPAVAKSACPPTAKRCDGQLMVPTNWADPRSPRIPVAYTLVPRTDQSRPALTTVVADGGGPGPLDPSYAELTGALLGPLADRVDVLMVEPRGFGKSSPLTCRGLDVTKPATITSCARQLGNQAGFYSTDQHVADIEAVRQVVGAGNVTFVGNSYGTLFAQAYASRYPDATRAMLLNSVVATGTDGYQPSGFRNPYRMGLSALTQACARSSACRTTFRNPTALWAALVQRLRTIRDPRLSVSSTAALASAVSVPDASEKLAAVSAYLHGDRAPLYRLATRVKAAPTLGNSLSPALFTYNCGDPRFPYDRNATADQRIRQLDAFTAKNRIFWPYARAESTDPTLLWTRLCAYWPTQRQSPPVSAGRPDVPVLAMSGQFDTVTAPADAATVASRFPRGRAVTTPFGGHGLLLSMTPAGACPQSVLRGFLAEPDAGIEVPCTAENYRLLGGFPRAASTIVAAYQTALDAIGPLNPNASLPVTAREPGLRGGHRDHDEKTGQLTLTGFGYLPGTTVDGTVRIDPSTGMAIADLTLRSQHVSLSWKAFQAEDLTTVTGTVDGRPFTTRIPGH
ncbi:alpha/beta fold hydrolase [Fodinicola acaciae]|uniref:alpha/beta fold hydrolase n=1 Tax=Fodinicola acaciae TaxID=2681555 RepID=UPI0013D4F88E|nr:alpha/beta fold hydrolase [Fodinicola acaciae]